MDENINIYTSSETFIHNIVRNFDIFKYQIEDYIISCVQNAKRQKFDNGGGENYTTTRDKEERQRRRFFRRFDRNKYPFVNCHCLKYLNSLSNYDVSSLNLNNVNYLSNLNNHNKNSNRNEHDSFVFKYLQALEVDMRTQLATSYEKRELYLPAKQQIDRALELCPGHLPALLRRGTIYGNIAQLLIKELPHFVVLPNLWKVIWYKSGNYFDKYFSKFLNEYYNKEEKSFIMDNTTVQGQRVKDLIFKIMDCYRISIISFHTVLKHDVLNSHAWNGYAIVLTNMFTYNLCAEMDSLGLELPYVRRDAKYLYDNNSVNNYSWPRWKYDTSSYLNEIKRIHYFLYRFAKCLFEIGKESLYLQQSLLKYHPLHIKSDKSGSRQGRKLLRDYQSTNNHYNSKYFSFEPITHWSFRGITRILPKHGKQAMELQAQLYYDFFYRHRRNPIPNGRIIGNLFAREDEYFLYNPQKMSSSFNNNNSGSIASSGHRRIRHRVRGGDASMPMDSRFFNRNGMCRIVDGETDDDEDEEDDDDNEEDDEEEEEDDDIIGYLDDEKYEKYGFENPGKHKFRVRRFGKRGSDIEDMFQRRRSFRDIKYGRFDSAFGVSRNGNSNNSTNSNNNNSNREQEYYFTLEMTDEEDTLKFRANQDSVDDESSEDLALLPRAFAMANNTRNNNNNNNTNNNSNNSNNNNNNQKNGNKSGKGKRQNNRSGNNNNSPKKNKNNGKRNNRSRNSNSGNNNNNNKNNRGNKKTSYGNSRNNRNTNNSSNNSNSSNNNNTSGGNNNNNNNSNGGANNDGINGNTNAPDSSFGLTDFGITDKSYILARIAEMNEEFTQIDLNLGRLMSLKECNQHRGISSTLNACNCNQVSLAYEKYTEKKRKSKNKSDNSGGNNGNSNNNNRYNDREDMVSDYYYDSVSDGYEGDTEFYDALIPFSVSKLRVNNNNSEFIRNFVHANHNKSFFGRYAQESVDGPDLTLKQQVGLRNGGQLDLNGIVGVGSIGSGAITFPHGAAYSQYGVYGGGYNYGGFGVSGVGNHGHHINANLNLMGAGGLGLGYDFAYRLRTFEVSHDVYAALSAMNQEIYRNATDIQYLEANDEILRKHRIDNMKRISLDNNCKFWVKRLLKHEKIFCYIIYYDFWFHFASLSSNVNVNINYNYEHYNSFHNNGESYYFQNYQNTFTFQIFGCNSFDFIEENGSIGVGFGLNLPLSSSGNGNVGVGLHSSSTNSNHSHHHHHHHSAGHSQNSLNSGGSLSRICGVYANDDCGGSLAAYAMGQNIMNISPNENIYYNFENKVRMYDNITIINAENINTGIDYLEYLENLHCYNTERQKEFEFRISQLIENGNENEFKHNDNGEYDLESKPIFDFIKIKKWIKMKKCIWIDNDIICSGNFDYQSIIEFGNLINMFETDEDKYEKFQLNSASSNIASRVNAREIVERQEIQYLQELQSDVPPQMQLHRGELLRRLPLNCQSKFEAKDLLDFMAYQGFDGESVKTCCKLLSMRDSWIFEIDNGFMGASEMDSEYEGDNDIGNGNGIGNDEDPPTPIPRRMFNSDGININCQGFESDEGDCDEGDCDEFDDCDEGDRDENDGDYSSSVVTPPDSPHFGITRFMKKDQQR